MEAFAQALNYGIPLFIILIGLEMLYGFYQKKITFNLLDTVSSLSSGITNVTKDVLGLIIAVISYAWLEENFAFFDLEVSWWMFPVVFVAKDFAGYWIHRFEHMVNYFWNRHMVHHSSEEYNLACALRQSISEIFSFSIFILFPLALLGVPVEVFAIVAPIHLFAQFWYHTRLINKMGLLEKVIVTPSHHRVHHAINPEYIDKNFSQIFIIWDKLFGTFQEELAEKPPVYGIKKPVHTWNPILINFQHAGRVWLDFFRTKSWKDKARIWFMPTGWRPEDVAEKYPIEIIENPYEQVKYMPLVPNWVKAWSAIQLTVVLSLALFLFNNLSLFGSVISLLFGAFIYLAVYSYTTIMDNKAYGAYLEIAKSLIALYAIYQLYLLYIPSSFESIYFSFLIVYNLICIVLAVFFFNQSKDEAQISAI
ncbi:MAG: sterol desaturase family protein [Chitinophagales bacterium]|nr:sterol desaturase family protein [Chitinophagales bacterium]